MILAIDPGTVRSAYVFWDSKTETIEDKGRVPNEQMLEIIKNRQDVHVVVEMVSSYGMPVGREIFETVLWVGRFVQVASGFSKVYRKDIKMYLCKTARAKDSHIRRALIARFGEVGTKKKPGRLYGVSNDIWSALAVAVYYSGK
jgi:hypothetical protein